MAIVGGITSVLVAIWNFIVRLLPVPSSIATVANVLLCFYSSATFPFSQHIPLFTLIRSVPNPTSTDTAGPDVYRPVACAQVVVEEQERLYDKRPGREHLIFSLILSECEWTFFLRFLLMFWLAVFRLAVRASGETTGPDVGCEGCQKRLSSEGKSVS